MLSKEFLSRKVIITALLLLQITLAIMLILNGSQEFFVIEICLRALSIIVVIQSIMSKRYKSTYKLTWSILILTMPLFGGIFYLLFNFQLRNNSLKKKVMEVDEKTRDKFLLTEDSYYDAIDNYTEYTNLIRYTQQLMGYPIYKNTKTKFLKSGEDKFKVMLEEMKKAKKYIFLEYFIIEEGYMWSEILSVLKERNSRGVKVRIIYDDLGCLLTLPDSYEKELNKFGIECIAFNKYKPILTVQQNNRDHRKICVIDGKVVITGGVNIADEYINVKDRFGHWKDAAIMLSGKAAWSFTVMFLQMWEVCTGVKVDYTEWFSEYKMDSEENFVQPYTDHPLDEEYVGEHVYKQVINNAKDYLYITTPYLIIDDGLVSDLCLAAKSGVDVKIITPHRWDKWLVHMTTKSYYRELIKAGVEIYEYSNGFIHSKIFVSDNKIGIVGTTNLDYRSLYLHYECGAILYGGKVIEEITDDFENTLLTCEQMTQEKCKASLFMRILQDILRLLAPLM